MLITPRVRMGVILGLITAIAAVVLAGAPATYAADTNTANTLKVSPVRTDLEIKPGETKTVKTTVTNLTDAAITVSPIENDFVSGDERGTPALILDGDKFAPTHSLKRFMTPLSDVTIEAGETKTISVVIIVPADAQAGGYFGAIRFAPTSPDEGGQVNLSPSVASLILLKVPGATVDKLALTDFSIQQNGKAGTSFRTPNDLSVSVRFENKGNVQEGPFGKVSVKKGDKVVYDTDFNNKNPRDVILPDSARRWDVPLKNVGNFGKYTVTSVFTYGEKNQTIESTQTFWVIPMSVIVMAAVGLLIVIGAIVAVILVIRKRLSAQKRGHYRRY